MSVWLIVGLVYWAGCILFLVASMALCDEHEQRWEMLRALAKERGKWVVLTSVSIGLLFLAAIAPIATPYWLVQSILQNRRERAYWTHLKRTHREYIFEPVHPVNLPDRTRAYFSNGGDQLERLRFTPLGDYRMKEEPADYFGRCFISGDGTIVCTLIDIFHEQNYGFSTIFSSGRMLETTSSECTEAMHWLHENDRYSAVYATDEPIEEGLVLHQDAVAAVSEREAISPLAFEPDAVHDFIRYEGRLFSQLLFERGELDDPPPTPQLPPHRVCVADEFDGDQDEPVTSAVGIDGQAELIPG